MIKRIIYICIVITILFLSVGNNTFQDNKSNQKMTKMDSIKMDSIRQKILEKSLQRQLIKMDTILLLKTKKIDSKK